MKRSVSIAGHRTSISIEPEFWETLALLARHQKRSVAALVAEIDNNRAGRNLSSAIRVWVLQNKLEIGLQ
jgi:predicted DNA-binding ribbon-helix-helix protein